MANALAGDHFYFGGEALYRNHRLGLDFVLKARGETNGPQHAQLIFGETPLGFADGAYDTSFQIILATNEVEHFAAHGVEHHAVDGEVAACGIFPRILTESNLIRMA